LLFTLMQSSFFLFILLVVNFLYSCLCAWVLLLFSKKSINPSVTFMPNFSKTADHFVSLPTSEHQPQY
jgi:hypothetical protein